MDGINHEQMRQGKRKVTDHASVGASQREKEMDVGPQLRPIPFTAFVEA
jgi:hypothetical protein